MLSIIKFAQNVSLTIINGLTNEKIVLPIIRGLFGLLVVMFLLLIYTILTLNSLWED